MPAGQGGSFETLRIYELFGLDDVMINSVLTNENGEYHFYNISNNNYILKPQKEGYTFFPDSLEVKINCNNFKIDDIIAYSPVNVENGAFRFNIHSPFPNPFNTSTTIQYEIPDNRHVKLLIYNILGKQINVLQDGFLSAGTHSTVWIGKEKNGNSVSSGIYLFKIIAGEHISLKKVMLLR